MISNLLLKNFQGFAGVQEIKLAPITLIFGPNASGKSSIYRALRYVKERMSQTEMPGQAVLDAESGILTYAGSPYEAFGVGLTFTGIEKVSGRNAFDLMNRKDDLDAVSDFNRAFLFAQNRAQYPEPWTDSLGMFLNGLSEERRFEFINKLKADPVGEYKTGSFLAPLGPKGMHSPWKLYDSGMSADLSHPWWARLLGKGFTEDDYYSKIDWLHSELNWNLNPTFQFGEVYVDSTPSEINETCWTSWWESASHAVRKFEIAHIGAVREAPKRINFDEGVAEAIFLEVADTDLINNWLRELTGGRYSYEINTGQVEGLKLETFVVKDEFTGALVDFQNVGSGISHILPILSACARHNLDYVYIEQPEQHLHPLMQSKLAAILAQFASNGKQIFIETHSENLLLGIQKLIRQGKLSKDMVSVVYAEATEGDSGQRHNHMFNLEMDNWGDLLDPFPLSFVDLRAMYIFDSSDEQ